MSVFVNYSMSQFLADRSDFFLQIEDVVHFVHVAKRPGVDEFLLDTTRLSFTLRPSTNTPISCLTCWTRTS